MNCDDVAREIDACLDGELGDDERRRLTSHVAECPQCSARFGALLRLVGELEAVGDPQAPAELVPSVLARLPEPVVRPVSARRLGWALGVTGVVAAAVAATAAALALLPELIWLSLTAWDAATTAGGALLGTLGGTMVWGIGISVACARALSGPLWLALMADLALLGASLIVIAALRHKLAPVRALLTSI
ncbi:MAG TPA: zf-HC2 domain-containing protein [Armatimonadota bacterium]|nr:zf-HC2 domain-containing protein [Armatimonadota bacterium]